MDRRDFLKTVAVSGAAMTIQRSEAMEILTQAVNSTGKPDLVAVMGDEPELMFQRAIAELGGMKQFVKALTTEKWKFISCSRSFAKTKSFPLWKASS